MVELQRSEELCIPKRRRLTHTKRMTPEGQEVLHVFYGEKEIIFDEPEFVPFGDKLIEVERFRAEETLSWSDGAPYEWEKVREMLEALLEQDILKRISETTTTASSAATFPARLGLAPPDREPRTFSGRNDQCPVITEEAFGRAFDLANLEVLVPIYRVAHPAMDQDGRQVGENNVTPRSLFLDLPTQRRVCNYVGSRYQADVPMNVTALKHMTKRWPELLSLSEQFRAALFARMPPRSSTLAVGEVHFLTVCCLASVAYVMVRGVDPVANGELDPGLASMFRLMDGVRLVTTDMMRETAQAHGCDRAISAESITEYAERYSVYNGLLGVCAGPPALIDEYLQVLLGETSAPIQVEPDVATRLGDLSAALDYGLHGQRIEALVRIFGASQGLLHHRLQVALRPHAPPAKLQELLDAPIDSVHYPLLRVDHPLVDTFKLELEVNRWLFARAAEALPKGTEGSVDELFKLDSAAQGVTKRRLAELFAHALSDQGVLSEPINKELAAVAAEVFALERRCLRAVESEQRQLNARLRRQPGRPLTGADLAVYNRPRFGPLLQTTLAEGLGVSVTTDSASTVLRYGEHNLTVRD